MPKNWKLKPQIPQDMAENLPDSPALVKQLLYNRGLTEPQDIEEFLEPKYQDLHDPFLFKDMEKAVGRIWHAIENKEKICIYGDYDADAVTANAVMQQTLKFLGAQVFSYIPDRFSEGYGINQEALQKISGEACKVIITVDCGTNSVEAAEFCKQNGMDLIITDHHEIIGPQPESYALINPKNPKDTYPYGQITGVGVAFKLACGILKSPKSQTANIKPVPGWEKWLLDLVAIGTVADCHSLLGENRILVKFGLKVLAKSKWPGLRALCKVSGLDFSQKLPDTYTLGFVIAPRINAAGRLEHANIALDLLMQKDTAVSLKEAEMLEIMETQTEGLVEQTMHQVANRLEDINRRRQDQTQRILSEAKDKVLPISHRKVLVLMGQDWNKGVVGLVAGKLAEEFHKPAIVLSQEGPEATGSARTVGEFNVVESLKHASEFLLRFGGHQQAAGLTLRSENFEKFYEKILEYAEQNISPNDLEVSLLLEAELQGHDLTPHNYNLVSMFEPFGVGNPKPKFLIQNATVVSTRLVGKDMQHLQLGLQVGAKNINAIYFQCGEFAKNLQIHDTINVAAELLEDSWNGARKLKLRVLDIKK